MSFPVGIFAHPAAEETTQRDRSVPRPLSSRKTSPKTDLSRLAGKNSLEFPLDTQRPYKKKRSTNLSSRAWASFTREKPLPPPPRTSSTQQSYYRRPDSISTGSSRSTPSFDFPCPPTARKIPARPKHVPIVIPDAYSYVHVPELVPELSEPGSGSFSSTSSGSDSPVSFQAALAASHESRPPRTSRSPRHVEIKIPDWSNPARPHHDYAECLPPVDNKPPFINPFPEDTPESSPEMSEPSELSRTGTMDSTTSQTSPENGSIANLSAHSSQTSLIGMRSEYESASEAEGEADTTATDVESGQHTPSQPSAPNTLPTQAYAPGTNPANLSGLVCNVHRTTGKEPHPLVGATTTVLGDKLYVFGGRRLSRTKPQLTSNLYELDLIRRHWTKIDPKGDVPSARYFHSMCALGDTKLVCYGGMSPAPVVDSNAENQPEVVVMSDVHIFDVVSQLWTRIPTPDAPQGRYAHCAAILPSSAVFASSSAPMSAVHHNPAGENPNQGSLGVALDGTGGAEMVVVGGQDSANHYIEQVSVFNLRSLKWTGTTGMGRSCGAYRSVVTPLTGMTASQIGAGPHARSELEEEDDEPSTIGSGAPMLIYSNYNFLDVKLELQVRLTDGTLTEKPMQTIVSPPGLRFPNGGVIDNHFVVSGTFLTSSKQEYALWALDLRTLTWSRIDAGGSIFSQGSWNRGVLWSRRNSFVVLGNRKRSLVDDYNNRRINFSNICVVELEAFGLYDNPKVAEPTSNFVSASSLFPQATNNDISFSRLLSSAAEDIGAMALNTRELADMDFLAIDGTRVPVNSRLISRRWGPHFISLLRESLASSTETDTATLRPNVANHQSRNSSITITPSIDSAATTLTANSSMTTTSDLVEPRTAPPTSRPRLLYLPHTAPTLHALLHYLYTLTLPSSPHPLATPQIFCSLLQLARPYKIDGLLEAVVERLHSSLDGRNAAAIFNAAAMGAGGGDSVHFATSHRTIRESDIPIRTASLGGMDGVLTNGVHGTPRATDAGLRINTEMANGRSQHSRNTLRQGQGLASDTEDEGEEPSSAVTDASDAESALQGSLSSSSSFNRRARDERQDVWCGANSSVVGLQKRGLRGLMEGRRMRERGGRMDFEGQGQHQKVGLGIA